MAASFPRPTHKREAGTFITRGVGWRRDAPTWQSSGLFGLAGLEERLFALFKGFDGMPEVVKVSLRGFKLKCGDLVNEVTEVVERLNRGQRRRVQVAIETARCA